ncbi:MAG: 16S rRNA (cytosine(967)-C(5))-methyltransferase RsmB [Bacilli bacterium]|nr:16S rRNA (cytosine(967)-C(5))-methyltransferase RsmB [Bacilli bacterium]
MNARKLAIEAINKIIEDKAYANLTVNYYLNKYHLSYNDRRLFTKLVYGTIENLIKIEYLLLSFIKKTTKSNLKYLLYMSVYQLDYTDIPAFAVVDEAVKIAKSEGRTAGAFVNAVLRNYIRSGKKDFTQLKPNEFLSIEYSHPLWLVDYLLQDYDYVTTEKILKENNSSRPLAVRVNTIKTSVEEVEAILEGDAIGYYRSPLVQSGLFITDDLHNHYLLEDGLVVFQDNSVQLVAEMMNPQAGAKIIDLCAGPGGKTAHLAALLRNTGMIYACDIYPHKIDLMNKQFLRLGIENVKTVLADATKIEQVFTEKDFDYVLADVPCSGLGVLSHKIDLKYRISLAAIEELINLQKEILNHTWYLVKSGGIYTYSTCTINPRENQKQIISFLARHPDAAVINERLILPFEYQTDGFYICIMEKRK